MRDVTEATTGERRGQMLVFRDVDGLRHAVRASAVVAASDVDESRDATLLQLPNSRYVVIPCSLDDVVCWLSGWAPAPGSGPHQEPELTRLRRRVEDARSVLASLMAYLADTGVVSAGTFRAMRDECLAKAGGSPTGGNRPAQASDDRGAGDMADLFRWIAPAEAFQDH